MPGIFTDHLDPSHDKQLPGSVREELLKHQALGHSLPEGHCSSGVTGIAGQEVGSAQTGRSQTGNAGPVKPGRFHPWMKKTQRISEYLRLKSVQENG